MLFSGKGSLAGVAGKNAQPLKNDMAAKDLVQVTKGKRSVIIKLSNIAQKSCRKGE